MLTMYEVGVQLRFEGDSIRIDDEMIEGEREYKTTWRKRKMSLQKAKEAKRIETNKTKVQQSQFYQEQEKECHTWLNKNLQGKKTSSIMTMLEQMVETKRWKLSRGLTEVGQ